MKSRRVMPEGRLDFRIRAERSLDAIPVGLSDNRCVVTMRIAQSNALIAGLPGSGKSVFENIILANLACLDSLVEIWAIDPKRVEMQPWKPLLYRLATEEDEFLPLLNGLADAMNQRYEYMAEHGLRKLEPDAEHPAIVLLIDELAELTATGDSKRDKAVAAAIRLLVQKGRAAGVSVIAATQRPSSDVVPTSLRDLFVQRCAMSCATVESARMILGDSIPENEGPQTIAASAKGVGYLMADTDREPTMFKSFYISDAQVARFVALAKSGAIRNGLVKSNGGGVQ
jgi:S-DNA-T family DNA segregation ATPase FtsK/SpoIIIE